MLAGVEARRRGRKFLRFSWLFVEDREAAPPLLPGSQQILESQTVEEPGGGWRVPTAMLRKATALACLIGTLAQPAFATEGATEGATFDPATLKALRRTISRIENMPGSERLQNRAARHGLELLDLTWEDTGRDYGSSYGPNISDVTLQMREPLDASGKRFRTHLLPVLRAPNFTDKTADLPADKLWVKVGNQSNGAQIVSVPLTEVLTHLREYVSDPDSILGSGDFSAKRDTHFLVSAQHVFVPIAETGKIEFTPVVFNYQSYQRHPAVMTLLVTRQGTSMTVLENAGPDAVQYGAGQQLYFNNKGQKTTLTAERRSTVAARIEAGGATEQDAGALEEGADMMWIVQVPLKVRRPMPMGGPGGWGGGMAPMAAPMELGSLGSGIGGGGLSAKGMMAAEGESDARGRSSDVERAVLGHGDDLGEVTEGHGLKFERDPQFPVRVTVQFYKATSNGVVDVAEFAAAKAEINKVYAQADYVGSLVVPEGERSRPTDWHVGKTQAVPVQSRMLTLPAPRDLDVDFDAAAVSTETTQTTSWFARIKSLFSDS